MDISLLKEKSLMDLREIAKMAGIKSVTKYRKGELLDMLYDLDRKAPYERGRGRRGIEHTYISAGCY